MWIRWSIEATKMEDLSMSQISENGGGNKRGGADSAVVLSKPNCCSRDLTREAQVVTTGRQTRDVQVV